MTPTRTPEQRRARSQLFRTLVRHRSREQRTGPTTERQHQGHRPSFLGDDDLAEDTPYRDHGFHPADLYSFSPKIRSQHIVAALWRRFDTPVFLLLLGLASSLISALVSLSTENLLQLSDQALSLRRNYENPWGPILGWSLYFLSCLTCSAIAVVMVHFVGPLSTGSGIPEMKSVLSGIHLHRFLSLPTLIAKLVGLIFAQGSGLSIGIEGPMVHMSACVAEMLLRLPIFSRLGKHAGTEKRLELLGAACATGVVAAFGATFGGILFSIEVTSTYYAIKQLPRAGFAAVFTTVMFHVFKWKRRGINIGLFDTDFDESKEHALWFYYVFIGIGVICGLTGAFFNLMVHRFCVWRNKYCRQTSPVGVKLLVVGLTVLAFVISMAIVNKGLIRESQADLIRDLFAEIDHNRHNHTETKKDREIYILLGWMLPWKLIFTAFCVVLPIPCGVFTPVFLSGAILGRCFGHWVSVVYPNILDQGYEPGEFAVIFGAALCAGMTQTISTAIIVLELVGQMHLRAPVAVAVVVAYFASKQLAPPVYDVFVWTKSIPFLYPLQRSKLNIPLRKLMRKYPWTPTHKRHQVEHNSGEDNQTSWDDSVPISWIPAGATHRDALIVLHNSSAMVFPVVAFVNSRSLQHENMDGHQLMTTSFCPQPRTREEVANLGTRDRVPILLGTLTRASLEKAVEHCEVAFALYMEERNNPSVYNQTSGTLWNQVRKYTKTARRFRFGTGGLVTPSMTQYPQSVPTNTTVTLDSLATATSPLLGNQVAGSSYGSATSSNSARHTAQPRSSHAVEVENEIDQVPYEDKPLWMVYQTGIDSYYPVYGDDGQVVLVPGMDPQHTPLESESPNSLSSASTGYSGVDRSEEVAGVAPFEDCFLLKVDPAPFTVPSSMPLSRCTQLFQLLKLSYAFVVHNGRLHGVVHRTDLIRHQRKMVKRWLF